MRNIQTTAEINEEWVKEFNPQPGDIINGAMMGHQSKSNSQSGSPHVIIGNQHDAGESMFVGSENVRIGEHDGTTKEKGINWLNSPHKATGKLGTSCGFNSSNICIGYPVGVSIEPNGYLLVTQFIKEWKINQPLLATKIGMAVSTFKNKLNPNLPAYQFKESEWNKLLSVLAELNKDISFIISNIK